MAGDDVVQVFRSALSDALKTKNDWDATTDAINAVLAAHDRDQNGVCVRCGACECCEHMVTVSRFDLALVLDEDADPEHGETARYRIRQALERKES